MIVASLTLGLPEYRWNETEYPDANTINQVDGPMTANGDLGVALGAEAGEGLVVGLGKNDFWGWTGKMDWHCTFNHFSPGQLRIGLALPGGGAANASFSGSQQLANGTLSASFRSRLPEYGLAVREVQVLADHNVIVGELIASCPGGADTVNLNVTLLDQPLVGPTTWRALPTTRPQVDVADAQLSLALTKQNAPRHSMTPLMLNCSTNMIAYNALRTFAFADGMLIVRNGSSAPLCLRLSEDGRNVSTEVDGCSDTLTQWRLTDQQQLVSEVDSDTCLGATFTNNTDCGKSTASIGTCRSLAWRVGPLPCTTRKATQHLRWSLLKNDFLQLVGTDRCLAAVPPHVSNAVAVVASLDSGSDAESAESAIAVRALAADGSSARVGVACNRPLRLTLSVATERDAGRSEVGSAAAAAGPKAALNHTLREHAAARSNTSALRGATARWWADWWAASSIHLGDEWRELQAWYETMMYLLRGSTRVGSVPAALWGPWSVTDTPNWADQMTLDYNFMANYWSAAVANHPEVIAPYTDTVLSLVPLSRARAALPDWSPGGWTDDFGGEMSGMSCGQRGWDGWDLDAGCPKGFGGFKGVEMPSATGPFVGMAVHMDDSERYVAGLTATPLIQYYEATRDATFLQQRLAPFLRDIADFYTSYSVPSKLLDETVEEVMLPYTCANERCEGATLGPHTTIEVGLPMNNAHQDLAYARMAYGKLLQYTAGDGVHNLSASAAERAAWERMLAALPPYPTVARDNTSSVRVWAESEFPNGSTPFPSSNGAYGIAHMAAVWPAGVVGTWSPPEEQRTARATIDLMFNAINYGGHQNIVFGWPAASLMARRNETRGLLTNYSRVVHASTQNSKNGYFGTGGGGLELIAGAAAIQALLLQTSPDGTITIFPSWPTGSPASFERLRASGFLVTAQWDGTAVVSPITVVSLAGSPLSVANPFPGRHFCARDEDSRLLMHATGDSMRLAHTRLGMVYELGLCDASA